MIKSLDQAKAVQERRVAKGLKGYAKAVRRYLLKNHREEYVSIRSELEVKWSLCLS